VAGPDLPGTALVIIMKYTVHVTVESRREVMTMCIEHSRFSRHLAGCLSHNVHIDCEHSHQLVFFEFWKDIAAVRRTFLMPETREFVRDITARSLKPPEIKLFTAEELTREALSGGSIPPTP
jgi:quinol monooxygenase YgiN